MKVGVDVRELENPYTGISSIILNFLRLAEEDKNFEYFLFGNQYTDFKVLPAGFKKIKIPEKNTFVWDQLKLLFFLKKYKIDVFFSPYFKLPLLSKVPSVISLYDITPLKYSSLIKKVYFYILSQISIFKARYTITISYFSREEIKKRFFVNEEKIKVIYPSFNSLLKEKEPQEVPFLKNSAFFLYVGNLKKHKNVKNLIKGFYVFCNKYNTFFKLVLAGSSSNEDLLHIRSIIQKLNLKRKIFILQNVSIEELKWLYQNAEAVFLPSLYEGFGLPLLEASVLSKRICASNINVFKEIQKILNQDIIFFNPYNIFEITKALRISLEKKNISSTEQLPQVFSPSFMYKNLRGIIEESGVKKILIIAFGGIGNNVLLLPLIEVLIRKGYRIKILLKDKGSYAFFRSVGFKKEQLMLFERGSLNLGKIILLWKENFWAGISSAYTSCFKSLFFFKLLGIKKLILHAPSYFRIFTKNIVSEKNIHEYKVYVKMASFWGVKLPSFPSLQIEDDSSFVRDIFKKYNIDNSSFLIGIHPGAGRSQYHFKGWPLEYFAELISLLNREFKNTKILVFGVKGEEYIEKEFSKKGIEFISLIGKTSIRKLCSLLRRCKVLIATDSGVAHLASALGVRVVVIFGPTDPHKIAPLGENVEVIKSNLSCSPCYHKGKVKCNSKKCLLSIKPQEVFLKVKSILKNE